MPSTPHHSKRRLMNSTAPVVLALAAGFALAGPAAADDTPDPPSRVGRVAIVSGTVSFHPSPDEQWTPASVNLPVAQSTAIWADSDGGAVIEIGDSRIQLDHNTELDVVQLDDANVILAVPQGRADIAVLHKTDAERFDIQTPRGDVDLTVDGNYRVIAGSDSDPSRVASFTGAAELESSAANLSIVANQELVATPGTPVAFSVAAAVPDAFDQQFAGAIQAVQARPPVPAYVPPMPGVSVLGEYGGWHDDQRYGHVWYPTHVEADWAPYRHGHWGYVAPWGYTWIDDAPWGFAPFHYGRWVQTGGAWGWIPVEPGVTVEVGYRPVYAPAMVTFIGNPAALTVGVAIGGGVAIGASVGWIPLGPGEPWHPWYHCSDNYLRQANIVNVNRTTITNITVVNNTTINNTYINQRAATVVPQTAFADGHGVQQAAYHIPAANLARPIPIEPARAATIQRVLPPPAPTAIKAATLPPAPKLAMPHPAAASATASHEHPVTAPPVRGVVGNPAANAVRKEDLPPPPKHIAPVAAPGARPTAEPPKPGVAEPPHPGQPGAKPVAEPPKPGVAEPPKAGVAEPPHPGQPGARPGAEPSKPGVAEPPKPGVAEPPHPGQPGARPVAEPPKPGVAEPPKPGVAEPPHPGQPGARPGAEPSKPGVAEPPKPGVAEPPHPGQPGARPGAEPSKPGAAEPPKPGVAEPPKPGARPGEVPHPTAEPTRPAPEAAKPAPRPEAEPPKPAPHPTERPTAEPAHPAPEAAKPRPEAEPPKPAPHPAPEAAKPAPRPEAEAPRPAPHPAAEAPKPAAHPAAEPPKPAPHPAAEPPKPAAKPAAKEPEEKDKKKTPPQ